MQMVSLLVVVLFAQAPRGLQPGTGIVTGAVRVDGGGSAAGIRVAAVPIDDPASLISVAETDAAGRYRLTNVPGGRYYIVAGRVANPTYYPGGTDRTQAEEILVEPARIRSSVDFSVPAGSTRPLPPPPAIATNYELAAYLQIRQEQSADKKLRMLHNFEQQFPASKLLGDVYTGLMEIYTARGISNDAEAYGIEALKLDPNNASALVQLSRLRATVYGDLGKALEYAEGAVSAVAKMKTQQARQPMFTAESWRNWVAQLEQHAKTNLDWVKQRAAWQRDVILSNATRRR